MTEISGFVKLIAEAEMKRVSALPLNEFREKLPEVKSVLMAARASNAETNNASVGRIKSKLEQSPHGVEYWGTATALINYQSGSELAALPSCVSTGDPKMKLLEDMDATQTSMKVSNALYENCEITLDAPDVQQMYQRVLPLKDIELKHCVVRYLGGLLLLPAKTLPGRGAVTIRFIDCKFDLSTAGTPPPDAQHLLSDMLASRNINHIIFRAG
jgi:hypothetical protein